MPRAQRSTLLIAIGNEFRCDDAAALMVARKLREMGSLAIIIENRGDVAGVINLWDDADDVILLDAVHSGEPSGTIHRFDAKRDSVQAAAGQVCSHNFSIVQAIELAEALGKLPRTLVFYGIEGERFEQGTELSAPVRKAIDELTTELKRDLAILR